MSANYVSLFPQSIEDELTRLMLTEFSGSVTIHYEKGSVRVVEVKNTIRVDGGIRSGA